jgi:hypothetical protein
LTLSHISAVSVPRTACAFSRAARRQLKIDEGLAGSDHETQDVLDVDLVGRVLRKSGLQAVQGRKYGAPVSGFVAQRIGGTSDIW